MLKRNRSEGNITISTTLSRELWDLAREKEIKWSEALRRGISIMLSDDDVVMYQTPLQMKRRLEEMSRKFDDMMLEKEKLEETVKKMQFGGQ